MAPAIKSDDRGCVRSSFAETLTWTNLHTASVVMALARMLVRNVVGQAGVGVGGNSVGPVVSLVAPLGLRVKSAASQ